MDTLETGLHNVKLRLSGVFHAAFRNMAEITEHEASQLHAIDLYNTIPTKLLGHSHLDYINQYVS